MNKKITAVLKYLLFVGLGIGLLWLTLRNQDFEKLFNDIRNADLKWILAGLGVALLAHILRAIRWVLMINPMGYKVSALHSFYAVMVGYMANYGLPRSGEVVRCGIMNRTDKVPADKLLGTVIVERIIDVIFLFLLVVISYLLQFELVNKLMIDNFFSPVGTKLTGIFGSALNAILVGAGGFIILVVAFFYFRKRVSSNSFAQKIKKILHGFSDGLKSVSTLEKPLLFWIYGVGIWACYFLTAYILFFALPATSGLSITAAVTVFVAGTIGVAAPTPGGLGSYNYMILLTLPFYGISEADANTWALLSQSFNMVILIFGGAISLMLALVAARKNNAPLVSETSEAK